MTVAEWDALYDEPPELWKLYCALRQIMNFKTGVIGKDRRINEGFIADCLYTSTGKGRSKIKTGRPSRQKCRSAIDGLVRIGLLSPIGEKGALIFDAPMAYRGSLEKSLTTRKEPNLQPKTDQENQQVKGVKQPQNKLFNNQPLCTEKGSNNYVITPTQSGARASAFSQFWDAYPNGHRVDRAGCQKKWKSRNLDEQAGKILADIERRKTEDGRWLRGYIPNSTTYLNQSRWESDLSPADNDSQKSKTDDAKQKFMEATK